MMTVKYGTNECTYDQNLSIKKAQISAKYTCLKYQRFSFQK